MHVRRLLNWKGTFQILTKTLTKRENGGILERVFSKDYMG